MKKDNCVLLKETRQNFCALKLPLIPANEIAQSFPDLEESFVSVEILNKDQAQSGKESVFSVYIPELKTSCNMKLYPLEGNKLSPHYTALAKYASLKHPSILQTIKFMDRYHVSFEKEIISHSCVIWEKPLCDFGKILHSKVFLDDEKLMRTFFHQLVEGIEYMHSKGLPHGNLCIDGLCVGQDYSLKIDLVSGIINSSSTASNQKDQTQSDKFKDDIYSLGILLFVFKTGFLPFNKNHLLNGYDLAQLVQEDPKTFWIVYNNLTLNMIKFSEDFKNLFITLVSKTSRERLTMDDIKNDKWYSKKVYNSAQVKFLLKDIEQLCL